jgi:hypothetical protein
VTPLVVPAPGLMLADVPCDCDGPTTSLSWTLAVVVFLVAGTVASAAIAAWRLSRRPAPDETAEDQAAVEAQRDC